MLFKRAERRSVGLRRIAVRAPDVAAASVSVSCGAAPVPECGWR